MDLAGYGVPSIWSLVGRGSQIAIIEFLTLQNLALGRDARYEVHFHIQGAFNKLYKADTDSGTALMRVSTPRHMSEVTTIELVRQETEMPIPKIIASDESDHSDFGLEWMLVELVAGQPLRKR